MNRLLALFLFVFLSVMRLTGQSSFESDIKPPVLDLGYFGDDVAPQVSMMNRYGSYPVDLANGLVDISIPLYTITTPGLSMPLKLSFHASGLRASEREGLLGVRWVLAGGGFISRIIRGYPDNGYRSFNKKVSNPAYKPNFYDLYGTSGPQDPYNDANNSAFLNGFTYPNITLSPGKYLDTEHDIYSYSLPSGKNGKFIWTSVDGNDEIRKGYTMPYEPIKAAPTAITDENGVKYCFGERGYTDKDGDNNIVTWHLTSIISQNQQDTILIDYIRCGEITNVREKSITICDNAANSYIYSVPSDTENPCSVEHQIDWFISRKLLLGYYKENINGADTAGDIPYSIGSISVRSGGHLVSSIEFNYEKSNLNRNKYLSNIIIKNSVRKIIRKVQFAIKKNAKGVGFLDTMSVIDNNNSNIKEMHTFDYYNWEYMPPCGEELSYHSDWWGFYSAGGGWVHAGILNINLPNNNSIAKSIGGGDKLPSFNSMITGMIKSIHYPTSGETLFEYDSNTWYDISKHSQVTYGGLRIKNIVNSLASGKKETKHYEYSTGYTPSFLDPPTNNWIVSQIKVYCQYDRLCLNSPSLPIENTDYTRRTFHSGFPSRYTDLISNIVSYREITEYDKDQTGNTIGKIVYQYTQPDRDFYSNSYYETVNNSDVEFREYLGFQIRHISPQYFWRRNKLSSKSFFKIDKKVKEYIYNYQEFYKESIFDLPVYKYLNFDIYVNSSENVRNSEREELNFINSYINETFAIKHQEYTIGAERLIKETENTYHDNGSVTSVVKETEYDATYLLPIKQIVTNSDAVKTVTSYKYPFSSLNISDTDVYSKMVSKNYLTPIIEKSVSNEEYINRIRTEYVNINNGFYPFKNSYVDLGTVITYHKYSPIGQPVYLSQNEGSEKTVYLWSYFEQYPIAEIKNVTYDEVCNALGGERVVTILADKIVPSSMDYTAIRNIRNLLPEAQITTVEYQPLVGITKIIDPKGLAIYYEYDALGRLKRSYFNQDNKQQTIELYDYHYIN